MFCSASCGADRRQQPRQAREVAARRRRADAVVQGHQVAGLRAAAAVAGAADPLRIDLGPRLEIVDRPHAVPDLEARRVAAQQDAAHADHACGRGAPELRPAAFAEVLAALALVDRIEDQRRHAVERQQGAHRLILVHALGLHRMAARHEHARIRRLETLARRAGTAAPSRNASAGSRR